MSECGKAVRWETYASVGPAHFPCVLAKEHEGPCREERDVLKQLEALDTPELARGAMRMHRL